MHEIKKYFLANLEFYRDNDLSLLKWEFTHACDVSVA